MPLAHLKGAQFQNGSSRAYKMQLSYRQSVILRQQKKKLLGLQKQLLG